MKKTFALLGASSLVLALAACDVDQTEEGDAPEISVEGGELPQFDVEPAEVNVETGTETVEVPTYDIETSVDDAEGEPVTPPSE